MNKKSHKSIYFLGFVLILLSGVVFSQISASYSKTAEKERELASLEQELSLERMKNDDLKQQYMYIETDDFIMKKAKEAFNLIKDGEILFIKEKDD